MNEKHYSNEDTKQTQGVEFARNYCIETYGDLLNNTSKFNDTCPPVFDGIMCWPPTPINSTTELKCPSYVVGFDQITNNASKRCMENGNWFLLENDPWTNFTQCYSSETITISQNLQNVNVTRVVEYMPIIKHVARTGYIISLSTLIVAFCIMFSIKKLHCARNKLHMHLFASFIFRAAVFFLKDFLFIDGIGMSSDILMKDGKQYFVEQKDTNNWQCKMFSSIWQYFITANYSWILMEGLYLHNLILLALFSDSNNNIKYYIILGWGLPALVVGSYIVARLFFDDDLCWTTYSNPYIFLIIKIPIMISNLINFALFINIARVLLSKLRSPISEETRLFRKWARSTLVLVPLFGVHYALFVGMSYAMGINETVELIWLFCDQLFASSQGFFVAVLYCFLNGEVKTELRPHFNHFVSVWLSTPLAFFNCGDIASSTTGRPSVCTTLSCSSLYTSSVTQKYPGRKSRLESNGTKLRHASIPENYQLCQIHEKSCPNHPDILHQYDSVTTLRYSENCCYSSKDSTQLSDITEITACLGSCDHSTKIVTPVDLEMITLAK